MKTIVLANLMLLPLTTILFAPALFSAYLLALVWVSKRNRRIAKIWRDYYKIMIEVENSLK